MPYKEFIVNERPVKIYKRKNSRHIKLSLSHQGDIKISLPYWASYKSAIQFAITQEDWLANNAKRKNNITAGQLIGKAYRIFFQINNKILSAKSSIKENVITISHNDQFEFNDELVQSIARKAAIKGLRMQSQNLLPGRIEYLAKKYNYSFNTIKIKELKRRWGSCDQNKNIVLNLYLIQLPWHLIDYVLIHELNHTKHLNHSPLFWNEMKKILNNLNQIKNELRSYSPGLI